MCALHSVNSRQYPAMHYWRSNNLKNLKLILFIFKYTRIICSIMINVILVIVISDVYAVSVSVCITIIFIITMPIVIEVTIRHTIPLRPIVQEITLIADVNNIFCYI